eukprot:scaffold26259_cov108-Cylindrotheca_fusiformis.AAC.1
MNRLIANLDLEIIITWTSLPIYRIWASSSLGSARVRSLVHYTSFSNLINSNNAIWRKDHWLANYKREGYQLVTMQSMEIEEEFASIDDPPRNPSRRRRRRPRWLTTIVALSLLVPLWLALPDEYATWPFSGNEVYKEDELTISPANNESNSSFSGIVLPEILMEQRIYVESDFINTQGIAPPYWNASSPLSRNADAWGPCFKPDAKIDWRFHSDDESLKNVTWNVPLVYRRNDHSISSNSRNTAGLCRPGFLILGAGKCGTSSLYHYLVGHPRVLPAVEKQIHYYKVSNMSSVMETCLCDALRTPNLIQSLSQYHLSQPLAWYYSWFPTTETFLENGALMTGEASPGYLPYPDVARAVAVSPVEAKLITLGRNPIDRIWSSYKYNYITPALETLRKGIGGGSVLKDQSDDYYKEKHLFSLEELVRAELNQLKKCLDDFGIKKTSDKWYSKTWAREEFDYRQVHHLPPLIDLDGVCYGQKVNRTVLREQWATLQMDFPEKYIPPRQAFLVQALIGRSLYVLPLEWWYMQFERQDLMFVCTEELNNATALLNLARGLGLPDFDFEESISQGAYNVGGHRGYDTATSWSELLNETKDSSTATQDTIPLSKELRQQLDDFLKPLNERLFSLVGKRCNW